MSFLEATFATIKRMSFEYRLFLIDLFKVSFRFGRPHMCFTALFL